MIHTVSDEITLTKIYPDSLLFIAQYAYLAMLDINKLYAWIRKCFSVANV